jgi:hypothetical protein
MDRLELKFLRKRLCMLFAGVCVLVCYRWAAGSKGRGPTRELDDWPILCNTERTYVHVKKKNVHTYWATGIWGPLRFGGPVQSLTSNMPIDGSETRHKF